MAVVWTHEKNVELIEIVQGERTINEGFNKAAEALETTYFACRNHWYSDEVKLLRGEEVPDRPKKKPVNKNEIFDLSDKLQESVINFSRLALAEVSALRNKIKVYEEENSTLSAAYLKLQTKYDMLEKDFAVLSRILDRAREMTVSEEIGDKPEPKKLIMEKNGNLEFA